MQAFTPIFDPPFSGSSYGFRPGRSAREAVEAAREFAEEGKDWVVDLEIASFSDEVNHDVLMNRIGQMIRDKRVLGLIGKYLRSGAMSGGVVLTREKGTPQGGPLSPLARGAFKRVLAPVRVCNAIRFCGPGGPVTQPPDTENRTSGGVGGSTDTIPCSRPDQGQNGQTC